VFDAQGRLVRRLVEATLSEGRHQVAWDGNGEGGAAPAGVYLYRLETGSTTRSGRVVLIR
jgi:flagellar hook assembly protein FlgD